MRAVLILASGAILSSCQERETEFTAEDEAAIQAMFDSTVADFRTGNFERWAGQFGDDGVLQPPNGPRLTGREAMLTWVRAMPPVEDASFSDVKIVGDGDMAYGTSAYVLKLQGAPPDTGKQLVVFRRSGSGGWQLVAGSFNSDKPVPQTAPAATPSTN